MNVASLKLCKELYQLSGWKNTEHNYPGEKVSSGTAGTKDDPHIVTVVPAYDLGYLLRKLPPYYVIYRGNEKCHVGKIAGRNFISNRGIDIEADTPEDAAIKLAVELFKQGVLEI